MVTPEHRRTAVTLAMDAATISERRACRFTGFARSSQRYRARRAPDTALRARLHELALQKPRWGYRPLTRVLRRERGPRLNYKRVQRLYQEEGLQVRRRRRKRRAKVPRVPMPAPTRPNERWSMDFVRDTLGDGRAFRALTIVDDCTRESPAIEVDVSLPGERVVAVLERVAQTRGRPRAIVCDNGPEFAGKALDEWAYTHGVLLDFIEPGEADAERLHRELQRHVPGGVPERELVRQPRRRAVHDRSLAHRVQHRSTAQPAAGHDATGVCASPDLRSSFTNHPNGTDIKPGPVVGVTSHLVSLDRFISQTRAICSDGRTE